MAEEQGSPAGPDLTQGVGLADFKNDMLLGHVGDDEVLLARAGSEIYAIDAHCSHYHGRSPMAWWWTKACAVPGITPVSICARARRSVRRRCRRCRSGWWSRG